MKTVLASLGFIGSGLTLLYVWIYINSMCLIFMGGISLILLGIVGLLSRKREPGDGEEKDTFENYSELERAKLDEAFNS